MNYELFMRAALAEADAAAATGDLADGAVAVMDEAMSRAAVTPAVPGRSTAHAVVSVIREASHRLGRGSLAGISLFCVVEPCLLSVGAVLAADIDGIVYALADPGEGACGADTASSAKGCRGAGGGWSRDPRRRGRGADRTWPRWSRGIRPA